MFIGNICKVFDIFFDVPVFKTLMNYTQPKNYCEVDFIIKIEFQCIGYNEQDTVKNLATISGPASS